ncbi:MAG: hypothetical protein IIC92_01415 [Chloroflexi bacterium]|nr:hypothetical protein [Chloroflexota bacterium]
MPETSHGDPVKERRFRPVRALAIALAVVGFVVAPVALHEAVHVATALIGGVSPSSLGIGFVGMYPGVKVDEALDGWRIVLFRYSGGLVAGAALLFVYVRWYWKWSGDKTSFAEWWLGALILLVAGNELGNGFAEGAFNAEYIANRDPATIISFGAAAAGFIIHRLMLGSRGARLAVLRGEVGDRVQIEEAARRW